MSRYIVLKRVLNSIFNMTPIKQKNLISIYEEKKKGYTPKNSYGDGNTNVILSFVLFHIS